MLKYPNQCWWEKILSLWYQKVMWRLCKKKIKTLVYSINFPFSLDSIANCSIYLNVFSFKPHNNSHRNAVFFLDDVNSQFISLPLMNPILFPSNFIVYVATLRMAFYPKILAEILSQIENIFYTHLALFLSVSNSL